MPRRPRRPARPGALADLAPLRILTQIAVLQVAFYVSAAIIILFTALVMGKEVTLNLLFDWRSLRGDITLGWTLGLAWMLNSLICVIYILLLIARSKLVLDFAITIHFLHLVITSFYTHSIPTNWFWWALQIASASLMTSLGVWSCQWRELRPIEFGGKSSQTNRATGNSASTTQEDDDTGQSRGRGRGRGRDGAGEYEMVGMRDSESNI